MNTSRRLLPALTLSLLTLLTACAQANPPQAPDKAIFIPQETVPVAPVPVMPVPAMTVPAVSAVP